MADYAKYEEAIARAIEFERRRDPHNALEWSVIALHLVPDDPVALRHKARAEHEIAQMHSVSDLHTPPLSLSDQEAIEKHLLLAESFLANGVKTLAIRELQRAIKIHPYHPHLLRLCRQAGIPEPQPTLSPGNHHPHPGNHPEAFDSDSFSDSAYDNSPAPRKDSDKSLIIRRLAVAKALKKAGKPDSARRILLDLQAGFGPLPEITAMLDKI